MKRKRKERGFAPSPLTSAWWGHMASAVFRGHYSKQKMHAFVSQPHKPATDKTPNQMCPCKAFQVSDLHWQQMGEAEKNLWRAAVKKRGTTGYQVFMKESLCLISDCGTFPDCPSLSGGYSCNYVQGGAEYPVDYPIGKLPNPKIGACCWPDGTCSNLDQSLCLLRGGDYQGGNTMCKDVECPDACPEAPPHYRCWNCKPDLPDCVYVCVTGAPDPWAQANGLHQLPFFATRCQRRTWVGGECDPHVIFIRYHVLWEYQQVFLEIGHECFIELRRSAHRCQWEGKLEFYQCQDLGCDEPNACEGAEETVAYVWPAFPQTRPAGCLWPEPPEAPCHPCCFEDGSCLMKYQEDCAEAGGIWHQEWDSCYPNPCPEPPPPPAVCCFPDGSCEIMTQEECAEADGVFHEEWDACDPNPCPPPGPPCDPTKWYCVWYEEWENPTCTGPPAVAYATCAMAHCPWGSCSTDPPVPPGWSVRHTYISGPFLDMFDCFAHPCPPP